MSWMYAIHPPPKDTPMCQIWYTDLKEQSYDPDTNQHRQWLLYTPPPNLFAGGIKRNFRFGGNWNARCWAIARCPNLTGVALGTSAKLAMNCPPGYRRVGRFMWSKLHIYLANYASDLEQVNVSQVFEHVGFVLSILVMLRRYAMYIM